MLWHEAKALLEFGHRPGVLAAQRTPGHPSREGHLTHWSDRRGVARLIARLRRGIVAGTDKPTSQEEWNQREDDKSGNRGDLDKTALRR